MSQEDAATAAALPADALQEIITRTHDFLDLLHFAATCMRWLGLIANPAFLRRAGFFPDDRRYPRFLLGVFFHMIPEPPRYGSSGGPPRFRSLLLVRPAGGEVNSSEDAETCALDLAVSRLGFGSPTRPAARADLNRSTSSRPGDLSFTSFIRNNADALLNCAIPLASRRGLLLLRVVPRTPMDLRKLHLAVRHPLIGEQSAHLVPPAPLGDDITLFGDDITGPKHRRGDGMIVGYALLTPADYGGAGEHQQPAFRVLLSAVSNTNGFVRAHSYSSATGAWSTNEEKLLTPGLALCGPRAGVVARTGTVHWLYRSERSFYTLDVSAGGERVSFTKVLTGGQLHPNRPQLQPPFPCVTGEGRLSLVNVDRRQGRSVLERWTKQGGEGEQTWLRSEMMDMGDKTIKIFSFAERRGALLVEQRKKTSLGQQGNTLFILDPSSKEMKQVITSPYSGEYCKCAGQNSCRWCPYNVLVPYEMDWPSYLLHHFAAGSR